jgi:hypothetical protein
MLMVYETTHMKRISIISGIIFVFLILFVIGFVKYSESPHFCNSCHIMAPYYKAWKTSKHNKVACVECHYPPGPKKTILWKKFQAMSQVVKFVTRTYSSKPYAEIEDISCLRSGCHSTKLLQGKMLFNNKYYFDHKDHLGHIKLGKQLRCTSCHSQIVVGKHIEVTYDTCYLCHLKDTKEIKEVPAKKCLICHELPKQNFEINNITYNHKDFVTKKHIACASCHLELFEGKIEVLTERCFACHNQPEKLNRIKDISFIHENHIKEKNVACFHCHTEIKHRVTSPGKKSLQYDCAVCHEDKHEAKKDFYRGVGAKILSKNKMPSPMYLSNVDCNGCHIKKEIKDEFGGLTYKGSEVSCEKCHSKEYRDMYKDSILLIKQTLALLQSNLKKIQSDPKKIEENIQQQLKNIQHDLNLIVSANPAHNIYFATQILQHANLELVTISEKQKIETKDLSYNELISGAYCAHMCHEKIKVNVPKEFVKYKGKSMPHKQHIESGLACTSCHDIFEHKRVKLKTDLTICTECHE